MNRLRLALAFLLAFVLPIATSATPLSIPNTFFDGEYPAASLFNANNGSIITWANGNIDNTNVGGGGFFASQIIPQSVGTATFGGSQPYTFSTGVNIGGNLVSTNGVITSGAGVPLQLCSNNNCGTSLTIDTAGNTSTTSGLETSAGSASPTCFGCTTGFSSTIPFVGNAGDGGLNFSIAQSSALGYRFFTGAAGAPVSDLFAITPAGAVSFEPFSSPSGVFTPTVAAPAGSSLQLCANNSCGPNYAETIAANGSVTLPGLLTVTHADSEQNDFIGDNSAGTPTFQIGAYGHSVAGIYSTVFGVFDNADSLYALSLDRLGDLGVAGGIFAAGPSNFGGTAAFGSNVVLNNGVLTAAAGLPLQLCANNNCAASAFIVQTNGTAVSQGALQAGNGQFVAPSGSSLIACPNNNCGTSYATSFLATGAVVMPGSLTTGSTIVDNGNLGVAGYAQAATGGTATQSSLGPMYSFNGAAVPNTSKRPITDVSCTTNSSGNCTANVSLTGGMAFSAVGSYHCSGDFISPTTISGYIQVTNVSASTISVNVVGATASTAIAEAVGCDGY